MTAYKVTRVGGTLTGAHIKWLRDELGETMIEFGARFKVVARTVEAWEQGRRAPNRWVADKVKVLYRKIVASRVG